jgi:outer membrane protein assembly factor BamE (lipoprotein component of BamABCDE complex)
MKSLYLPVVISIFFTIFLNSCAEFTMNSDVVSQKLSESYKLHEGMTKSEVEAIMGVPVKSDFYKSVDEWHYCKTGYGELEGSNIPIDEFIALFFYEGKLVATKNYTVSLTDVDGATGSCEKFIKMGKYTEPDIVTEIRSRGDVISNNTTTVARVPHAETSSTHTSNAPSGMEEVIKKATSKLMDDLPRDSKIAVVELSADDWEIASTIIDEIEYNFVLSKRYTIVDRKTLDIIRREQELQTSGAISDETIVKIGALSGASVVIAGSLTKSGWATRLSLRALDVQTGQIITMARESY